jgi:hypothetical protein
MSKYLRVLLSVMTGIKYKDQEKARKAAQEANKKIG